MKHDLPQFTTIHAETIATDLSRLLAKNKAVIDQRLVSDSPFGWDDFMRLIEELDDELHQFWAPVAHLNAVVNTSALRQAYHACLPMLSDYSTTLLHNEAYYKAVKSIADSQSFAQLDFAQKKVIEHQLRDFRLAGIALSSNDKKKFAALSKKLSQLTAKFEENVLDATQAWTHLVTDERELVGLPNHAIDAAAAAADGQQQQGWLFTLEMPSYLAVMKYADSRSLRQTLYYAFVTRASDQGPNAGQYDNSDVMVAIVKTRFELAKLLGFNHYAEYSLATKMLDSTEQVFTFLQQLADASLHKAKIEYQALVELAAEQLQLDDLQAWDIAYVSEKLRQKNYQLSPEDLRPYFAVDKVLAGLFAVVRQLFNLRVEAIADADRWHADVMCFAIYQGDSDVPISYFYLDLYARENKRGGAWMDDCRSRRQQGDGSYQTPVAFIVCNINAPVGDDPALLTHDDVVTLFHEFGHALQHMLTTINYVDVAGINGIPWDAVEIASQFMENYAWQKAVVMQFAEHYQSKELLPDLLFTKMHHAKNFQSALQMVRQLEFALFDFRLHSEEADRIDSDSIQRILDEVRQRISVIPIPVFNRFQHSFSHIFAGGYAAGYYSYKWAEVMAQDAFSLFSEKGIFDQKTSTAFRDTFLAMGGAKAPMDVFLAFRGRRPEIDALLRDSGIVN